MRYFIRLAYYGKNYIGWQIQPNGISIQSKVNYALSTVLNYKITVTGCGRTDSGVHAERFYAHAELDSGLSDDELNSIVKKVNGILPEDIAIYSIQLVIPSAHARFSALSRTYEYRITREKNPFTPDRTYYYQGALDIEVMNKSAAVLLEYADFTSFAKLHSNTNNNVCSVKSAIWMQSDQILTFRISADRFLRNMVRSLVGTMLDAGRGKITIDDFRNIIESKNRAFAGTSMPAKGLFLVDVHYPPEIFITDENSV